MEKVFFEISLILITSAVFGTIAKFLKQPIIPAYILAGVFLGPLFLNIIFDGELLKALSTFGIAFLLFLVGIELDIRKFFKIGKVSIVAGFLQMLFVLVVGFIIIKFLGFKNTEAILLAFAMGFSSTIIGLKLIGEKKELDTLYSQIVIGIMLTQDMIAIFVLLFFDVFTGQFNNLNLLVSSSIIILIKAVALFGIAFLSSKFILKKIFHYLANTSELLFLGSVCWCLIFCILSIYLGFSIEVGALIAGVSLSFIPYGFEISYRIRSLRDFFLPIFFAILGGQLVLNGNLNFILSSIVLSIFVLIFLPVIVILFLIFKGYRAKTSFQAGIAISQISEFSFVLIALAYTQGIVTHQIVSLVALIGLITMTISSYMFEYNDKLYMYVNRFLKKFEQNSKEDEFNNFSELLENHIILIGYNPMGYKIYQSLKKTKKQIIVIDNNPNTLEILKDNNIKSIYGSMNDDEVLQKLNIQKASSIISTVRSVKDTVAFLEYIKNYNINIKIIVTAFTIKDALLYYKLGANYVLIPQLLSSDIIVKVLKTNSKINIKELKKLQKFHSYF